MKVVDASAVIDFLMGAPNARALAALLDDDLYAPDLLVPEVVHHVRYEERGGRLDAADATRAIEVFEHAAIDYMSVVPFTAEIWALRHNVSAYDACYVALASHLDCPLLTSDRRLANAPGLPVAVVLAN